MGRPSKPLISRQKVVRTALRLIDKEGYAALSMRRLGQELKVNGQSLYHHFSGKDEIIVEVMNLAMVEVSKPDPIVHTWHNWLLGKANAVRSAHLRHPALIPIVIVNPAFDVNHERVGNSANRLIGEGVPGTAILPLMLMSERLSLVSALQEIGGTDEEPAGGYPNPALRRAQQTRGLDREQLFDTVFTAVVDTMVSIERVHQVRVDREQRPPADPA